MASWTDHVVWWHVYPLGFTGAPQTRDDLADGTDTRTVLAEAKAARAPFVAGPDFMLEGGEASLRLSFASVPPQRIGEGVERIAAALERVRAAAPA